MAGRKQLAQVNQDSPRRVTLTALVQPLGDPECYGVCTDLFDNHLVGWLLDGQRPPL